MIKAQYDLVKIVGMIALMATFLALANLGFLSFTHFTTQTRINQLEDQVSQLTAKIDSNIATIEVGSGSKVNKSCPSKLSEVIAYVGGNPEYWDKRDNVFVYSTYIFRAEFLTAPEVGVLRDHQGLILPGNTKMTKNAWYICNEG